MKLSRMVAAATATLTLASMVGHAAAQSTAPARAKPAAAAPSKTAKPRAKAPTPTPEVFAPLTPDQLVLAERVLVGSSRCEFNQTVDISPVADRPGYFKVSFKKLVYTMAPQETTTGAVRLEDARSGAVWIQILTKSMMMNQKIGQRIVDGCVHATQQAFLDSAKDAVAN